MILHAAKAVGIQALDSVHVNFTDEKSLRKSVKKSIALGFVGIGAFIPIKLLQSTKNLFLQKKKF